MKTLLKIVLLISAWNTCGGWLDFQEMYIGISFETTVSKQLSTKGRIIANLPVKENLKQ